MENNLTDLATVLYAELGTIHTLEFGWYLPHMHNMDNPNILVDPQLMFSLSWVRLAPGG